MTDNRPDLSGMRSYFESGETLPYKFKKIQLLAFQNAIRKAKFTILINKILSLYEKNLLVVIF